MKITTYALGLLALTIPLALHSQPGAVFSDIPAESRFFVPVNFLKEKNLVSGYSDGAFHPERNVNRAEALAMILKVSGSLGLDFSGIEKTVTASAPLQISLPQAVPVMLENLATGEKTTVAGVKQLVIGVETGSAKLTLRKPDSKKPFRDVSQKDWFYDIVSEAKKRGIVKGQQKGAFFRPLEPVNLAQALRMLFQSAGVQTHLSEGTLPEGIAPDAWYAKDMAYAVKKTLLTQKQNGAVFPPEEILNRGEMALLIYRFLKMREGASFGYASWYGDGLAKTKLTENSEYAEKYLTAAHRSLPFGTILRITNMANGKTADVVVNDRGPFVTGRIIDLSKTAFSALETPSAGIIPVQVEIRK